MTFGDIWPVYFLFAAVLLCAATVGRAVTARAFALMTIVHAGPLGVLVWATVMFGQSSAGPAQITWMELVQLGILFFGLAVVVMLWWSIRKMLPNWTALAFFAAVAIINLMAMFVTGMALTNDWI